MNLPWKPAASASQVAGRCHARHSRVTYTTFLIFQPKLFREESINEPWPEILGCLLIHLKCPQFMQIDAESKPYV
ncbi:hypothetical protein SLE2022_223950 [Rubroshorea leprosula]